MCGLIGIADSAALGYKRVNFVEQGLYVDQLRGKDSTGIALVDKDNNVAVHKLALAASDWLQTRLGKLAIREAEKAFIVVGHNRATTIGSSTTENAHPFSFGRFTGAHNGTINAHKNIFSVKDHAVDSKNLIASLDKDQDVAKTLSGIHTGAYAITVYDSEEEQMVFARNDERPLFILDNGDHIMWGSEGTMLYWLAERNGLLFKDSKMIDVPTETVLRYDCNNMEWLKREKYKATRPSYTGYTPPSNVRPHKTTRTAHTKKVEGHAYDESFSARDAEGILATTFDNASIIPVQWEPYSAVSRATDKTMGTVHGYIFDKKELIAWPIAVFGVERASYEHCMSKGVYMQASINTVNMSKEGEVIAVTGSQGKITDIEVDMFNDTYMDLWTADVEFGRVWSAVKGFTKLNDTRIRKAVNYKMEHGKYDADCFKETAAKKPEGAPEEVGTNIVPFQKDSEYARVLDTTKKYVPHPNGSMTVEDFSRVTECGCAMCTKPIYVEDAEDIAWTKSDSGWLATCVECTDSNYETLAAGIFDGTVFFPRVMKEAGNA